MVVQCLLLAVSLPVVPAVRSFSVTDRTLPPEGYRIRIDAEGKPAVEAADEAGRFYAAKTLEQLGAVKGPLEIEDWPAYAWRGVMLDEGRHFFGLDAVKRILDDMARLKLNVFHWHLTEDQGWRLDVPGFPELVKYGAVRPSTQRKWTENVPDGKPYGPYFYTPAQVQEILAYAKARHIRVIPEIELPGHIRGLLAAHPEFSCTGDHPRHPWCETGVTGEVLCIGNDEAIRYLERVLDEVVKMFPDEVVHIGGDEAPQGRWKACPKCQARMKAEGLKDESALQGWCTRHFAEHLARRGRRTMGWDEICAADLPPGVIVQYWRSGKWFSGHGDAFARVRKAAERGAAIVASPYDRTYFSVPMTPDDPEIYRRPVKKYVDGRQIVSLESVRTFDPQEQFPADLKGRVIGAEACNWTEATRSADELFKKMWPRTEAFAEALWTGRRETVADGVTLTRDGAVVYVHFHKPGVDTVTFKAEGEFACGMQLRDGRLATLARTADGQLSVTARRPAGFAGELVVKLVPALANPFARKGIELAAPEAANVGRFCTFVKERLAKDGFDTLFLRTGFGYEFESHPECRNEKVLSKADAKRILAACRSVGIKVVPLMNLFGHQSQKQGTVLCGLLKGHPDMDESRGRDTIAHDYCRSLCPRHPRALGIASDLAYELAQGFESDVVHVGCDEVFEIGLCERCKGTPTGQLFAEWVNGLAAALKQKSVRMMIWGDRLVDANKTLGPTDFWESSANGTHTAVDAVDRGIEICDWRYWLYDSYPSVDIFAEHGFHQWVSPWCHLGAAKAYVDYAKAHDRGHVVGLLLTTWYASEQLMDALEGEGIRMESEKAFERLRGVVEVYRAFAAKGAK